MTFGDWLARLSSDLGRAGLQRQLRPRSATSRLVDLAGNDYLGLSRDVRVTAAAAAAATTWGAGAGASRLVNTSRPFIYDTGLAPASTGAALEALRIIDAELQLPRRARGLAGSMASALGIADPAGSVLSVPMASAADAGQAQTQLANDGFLVGCFRPPSVPDGVSRLRVTARASLTDAVVARVVDRLACPFAGTSAPSRRRGR